MLTARVALHTRDAGTPEDVRGPTKQPGPAPDIAMMRDDAINVRTPCLLSAEGTTLQAQLTIRT